MIRLPANPEVGFTGIEGHLNIHQAPRPGDHPRVHPVASATCRFVGGMAVSRTVDSVAANEDRELVLRFGESSWITNAKHPSGGRALERKQRVCAMPAARA